MCFCELQIIQRTLIFPLFNIRYARVNKIVVLKKLMKLYTFN